MRLPERTFERVRQSLGLADRPAASILPPAGGDAGRAMRREPRWLVEADVPLAPRGSRRAAEARPVRLLDISAIGASVLVADQMAPGDLFVLYLPYGPGASLPVTCTVRTTRIKRDGTFRVGAEFAEVGAATRAEPTHAHQTAAPATIVTPGPEQPAPEESDAPSRRRSERTPAPTRPTIYLYHGRGRSGPLEEVAARDYSDTGVCIYRGEPIAVGGRFMFRMPVPDAGKTITRLCRVTNVTAEGRRYRIGAAFIPFPDEDDDGVLAPLGKMVKSLFR